MASQAKIKAELDTLTDLSIIDGTAGQVLTTDGAESFSFQSVGSGTVDYVATGTITTGDIVGLRDDGTVEVVTVQTETITSEFPSTTTTTIENSNTGSSTIIYDSNSNRIVSAYTDNNNSEYGTVNIGEISSNSITFGTPVVFESAATAQMSSVFDASNNKVVIVYQDRGNSNYGTAIIGTVSGDTITFGTPVVFESADTSQISTTFDSNTNKVVIAYRDSGNSNYGTAVVGTVSGTSITFGSHTVFESTSITYTSATFDSNTNQVVIAYLVGSGPFDGSAVVGTVSGTDITFGSPVVFQSGNCQSTAITFDPSNNKIVIAYRDGNDSNSGKAIVGTVSGTSISFGTSVTYTPYASNNVVIFDPNVNKIVVMGAMGANISNSWMSSIAGTVSGSTINFDSVIEIPSLNDVTWHKTAYDSESKKIAVSFTNGSNSNFLDALVFTTGGTAISGTNADSWIGIADENIADGVSGKINILGGVIDNLSSLTVNTEYYVNYDGTLTTTENAGPLDGTYGLIGKALSTTELLIVGPLPASFPITHYGASGGDVMFGSGIDVALGPYPTTVDIKQFSNSAYSVDHGDLLVARRGLAAASDGTQVMFANGVTPTSVDTCEMKQFNSIADAVDHGNLSQARPYLAAGSDGSQVLFGGGNVGGGLNTVDIKQFSSTSIAIDHGDLSEARYHLAAGSDGSQVMFGAGNDGSVPVNTVDIKQFASTAIAVDHGDLSQARNSVTAGSDGNQVMFGGGIVSGSYTNTVDMKQFSSTATAVDHGDLTEAKTGIGAGSDGVQVMFGGGFTGFNYVNTCDMKQFSSTATAVDHGDLTVARYDLAAASGN